MKANPRQTEIESADVLLDVGVSIPLFQIKVPFTKKHLTKRVTMRRPTMGSLIRIAKLYLQMGVKVEELQTMTKEQQFELLANHGDEIAEIVMVAILRDRSKIWWFGRLLKWWLMNHVNDNHLTTLNREFAPLYGTQAFGDIIKSVEGANPLVPRMSR